MSITTIPSFTNHIRTYQPPYHRSPTTTKKPKNHPHRNSVITTWTYIKPNRNPPTQSPLPHKSQPNYQNSAPSSVHSHPNSHPKSIHSNNNPNWSMVYKCKQWEAVASPRGPKQKPQHRWSFGLRWPKRNLNPNPKTLESLVWRESDRVKRKWVERQCARVMGWAA